jgi:hypothetical protein
MIPRGKTMKTEAGWSEPFHDAWMEHTDRPYLVRLAHAIAGQWLGSKMSVEPGELITGHIENSSVVYWSFAGGVSFNRDLWNSRYSQADEDKLPYLEEMRDEWQGRTSGEIIWPIVTPEERVVCIAQSPVAPGCHASPPTKTWRTPASGSLTT